MTDQLNLENLHQVHFIGVGGIGVSAVAKMLLYTGVRVSGSDTKDSDILRELVSRGATIHVGHAAANLPAGAELVVRSGAVPEDNPELVTAQARGIPSLTYFEFLGRWSASRRVIAVAGTHGKSTTTAMLGSILIAAGFDPTVIVGSKVASFPDGNLRLGDSDWLVVEACEHEAHFLQFHPYAAVVTNIEADHLDYYRDLEHIRQTFRQFSDQVKRRGVLIVNADDEAGSARLFGGDRAVSFGFSSLADYRIENWQQDSGRQSFYLSCDGKTMGDFELRVPGRFNVSNAAAAAAMALELGVPAAIIKETLSYYIGIWRRFEVVGERDGAIVVSDYGHHPTAVAVTLAAAKEFYPGRQVVLVFQPHHRNRTRNLFTEFVSSFDGADALILPEIFEVIGRDDPADQQISSVDLVRAVVARDRERGRERVVEFVADQAAAEAKLRSLLEPNTVVIIMGAGDIDQLARRLV